MEYSECITIKQNGTRIAINIGTLMERKDLR